MGRLNNRNVFILLRIAVRNGETEEKEKKMNEDWANRYMAGYFNLCYMEGYLKQAVKSAEEGNCTAEWALKDAYREIQEKKKEAKKDGIDS